MQTLQRAKMFGIDISAAEEGDAADDVHGEWQTTDKRNYRKVFGLLRKTSPFAEEKISEITHLWKLDIPGRFKLYKYWLLKKKTKIINIIKILSDEYKTIKMKTHKVWVAKNVEILRSARVVGMTTTGAAKHRESLQKVGCPIIIVEEAAEVLEAHVVTTLNESCQHLILIGDHQQLRPNPTVYRLAKDFNLDISLFERLVKNDFPRVFLNRQHRMRPEISCFIKPLYESLEDHESVFGYDHIRGVATNVFFLKHSKEEGTVDDNKSKANIHEAKFITALCKYFLQHGYSGDEITILAAYSGQVAAINREMGRQEESSKKSKRSARSEVNPHEKRSTDGLEVHKHPFSSVQVSSIDSYQGEENKIILLSLVRSNREGKVGFLKSENRLCVALSRAREGFYAIGNFDMMESKSTLWGKILKIAREAMVLGDTMKLMCINHPQHETGIANAKDFKRKVPEGGCDRPCGYTLLCGHSCPKKCHALDSKHTIIKCQEKCSKPCNVGHICQKKCYEDCGRCTFKVKKTLQGCGHEGLVECGVEAIQALCEKVCKCELQCSHVCKGRCGSCAARGNHSMCDEIVTKTWLLCKHTNTVQCHTDPSTDPCPEKCSGKLECGHKCKGKCGECLNGRVHKPCAEKCKETLACGHSCPGSCGTMCVPCTEICPNYCRHGSAIIPCTRKCGELCERCRENCGLNCRHEECIFLCTEECSAKCSKECNQRLDCQHNCASLCREVCMCSKCRKDEVILIPKAIPNKPALILKRDNTERNAKFKHSDDVTLMKLPRCKHVFTFRQLKRYMDEKMQDSTGTAYISCPSCKIPIQGIAMIEKMLKRRGERREAKKKSLIDALVVSEGEIISLKMSKSIAGRVCEVDKGEYLTRFTDKIDANIAKALNMQFRFSRALSDICNIHIKFNPDKEFPQTKWKKLIESIQKRATAQFLRETSLELHRLLLLEQAVFLRIQCANQNLRAGTNTLDQILAKDLRVKLESRDTQKDVNSKIKKIYVTLGKLGQSCEMSHRLQELQAGVAVVANILDKPEDKNLWDIMKELDREEHSALNESI